MDLRTVKIGIRVAAADEVLSTDKSVWPVFLAVEARAWICLVRPRQAQEALLIYSVLANPPSLRSTTLVSALRNTNGDLILACQTVPANSGS